MAAITNFRHIPSLRQDAPSRGMLVKNFLTGKATPADYLTQVQSIGNRYNGFNLIVGDAESLFYYSNKRGDIHRLSPGLYGLSNHLLNTPWPKVQKAKTKFQSLLTDQPEIESNEVFKMLHDTSRPPDDALPDTGIGLEWERLLSPMFITSETYGTRSSSVIIWEGNGEITFAERTYDGGADHPDKETSATKSYHLQLA
jgi:uncharacterized protein with NRDE domain